MMLKLILFIFLLFSVSSVANEKNIYDFTVNKSKDWFVFAVGKSDSGEGLVYNAYNTKSVRDTGDVKTVEEIAMFEIEESIKDNNALKYKYISTNIQIDCKNYKIRPLGVAAFYTIDRNLIGEVDNQDNHSWIEFAIGTTYDGLHKLVC